MSGVESDLLAIKPIHRIKRAWNRTRLAAQYCLSPRTEHVPLFILAQPRTGSTLLGDYLDSIPGVAVSNEILSPTLPCGLPRAGLSQSAVRRHIRQSLSALKQPIAGTKFLLNHLILHDIGLADLRGWFPNAHYLIIYRAALLEQFISFQTAKATGQWVGRKPGQRTDHRLQVDPEDFRRFCRAQHERYAEVLRHDWLAACGRIIRYEDLAADPQTVFDELVFPLLGAPRASVSTGMRKQNHRRISDIVENLDELADDLSRHGTLQLSFSTPTIEHLGRP